MIFNSTRSWRLSLGLICVPLGGTVGHYPQPCAPDIAGLSPPPEGCHALARRGHTQSTIFVLAVIKRVPLESRSQMRIEQRWNKAVVEDYWYQRSRLSDAESGMGRCPV
jgi:hypothetical protein